jgi:hypothetical protein
MIVNIADDSDAWLDLAFDPEASPMTTYVLQQPKPPILFVVFRVLLGPAATRYPRALWTDC